MLRKSIYLEKLPAKLHSKVDVNGLLDLIELLAIAVCIPISYLLTNFFINNFEFPFYQMEFKMFILEYLNYFNYSWSFDVTQFSIFTILILVSWYTLSQLTVMAKLPRNQRYLTVIIHFIRGNFYILIILLSFKFILNLTSISVVFIFTYVGLSLIVTLAIRIFSIHFFKIYRASGYNIWNILVVVDDNYSKILQELNTRKELGIKIVSLVTDSEKIRMEYGSDIPILSNTDEIKNTLDNSVIDEVLYCRKIPDNNELIELAEICSEVGVVLRIQSSESKVDPIQMSLKTINQNGKLTLVDVPALKVPLEIKTLADLYLSLLALILLFPMLLIIAILIKIESRGPIFFKQERVGLRGRKFNLYKFRTMVHNAEELIDRLRSNNEMDGPTFKMKHDPRITKLGRFLRKTGIDEFPQLYNVISGEMSLIGPRPPLMTEVKQYERWQLRRLSVKPGITCTWQIMPQRNDIKFERWMYMDLNYIDNWSLGLDFKLFYKTIATFFLAGGR